MGEHLADISRECPGRVARLADDRMIDHMHMEATRSRGLLRSFDGCHASADYACSRLLHARVVRFRRLRHITPISALQPCNGRGWIRTASAAAVENFQRLRER